MNMKKIIFTALMSYSYMAQADVSLKFSDGRADMQGVAAVNQVLNQVGVNITTHNIPAEIQPVLAQSLHRSLNHEEREQVMQAFQLNREDLLHYTQLAGRKPAVKGGGNLTPKEGDNGYPYLFDASQMDNQARKYVLEKYGRLHVNSADDGTDLDEVMTVVSGGPFRWAFTLKDGTVARLDVDPIQGNDPAVRVAYHGLGMHAGIIEAEHGVFIGYGFGPERFTIRYQSDNLNVAYPELLNTNPWIDYNYAIPKVVDTPINLK